MPKNSTPDLKTACGHGFDVCFSTECAKPENWPELLRKRVIEIKYHYEAINRITEQTRNEIGEAYHKGLNDRGEEVAALKAENEKLAKDYRTANRRYELLHQDSTEEITQLRAARDCLADNFNVQSEELTRLREFIEKEKNNHGHSFALRVKELEK